MLETVLDVLLAQQTQSQSGLVECRGLLFRLKLEVPKYHARGSRKHICFKLVWRELSVCVGRCCTGLKLTILKAHCGTNLHMLLQLPHAIITMFNINF